MPPLEDDGMKALTKEIKENLIKRKKSTCETNPKLSLVCVNCQKEANFSANLRRIVLHCGQEHSCINRDTIAIELSSSSKTTLPGKPVKSKKEGV